MSKLAIITDTDAGLPFELAARHNIVQVPIQIQFGEESFRDGYEIDNRTVFARIDREKKIPTTAAPAPGQFYQAFEQAFAAGAEEILCLNISSEMSATYVAARQAAEMFTGRKIEVMDTRSVSLGEGFMALAAAQTAAAGASLAEARAAAESVRSRTFFFGALSTLKYIAMSGRVSALAAGMAGMLDIRPILSIQDGKLALLEKVRTQGKAWARALELAAAAAEGRAIAQMGIVHVNAPEAAQKFEALLRASGALTCPAEILRAEMLPGLSVHTGAGLVALALVTV
ncbi:MAG: DegV family protein [Anaerolineales bacterium]